MGIIILDPDPPPSGPKGKAAEVTIEPNGMWQIVKDGEKIAEFDEYDDAVQYLGHIDPLRTCHK
jgi:hypothetical protein